MVVQVNGKVRGKIEVSTSCTEQEMKESAKEIENVKIQIEGKTIEEVKTELTEKISEYFDEIVS